MKRILALILAMLMILCTFASCNEQATVQGEKGEQGEKGDKGDKGDQGIQGVQGEKGDKGEQGASGKDAIAPQIRINSDTNEWELSSDNGTTWASTGIVAVGKDGEKGEDGENGESAIAPQIRINANNEWEISTDDGKTWLPTGVKATGEKGDKGDPGAKGDQGDTGRGILKTEVIDGYLWITYTDDLENPINVGKVLADDCGLDFYTLPDGTYAVSAGKVIYLDKITIPATYWKN